MGEAQTFGKPVWDFDYPESTFFISETALIGCSTGKNHVGDVVFVPLGSVYPLILRSDGNHYILKVFAYFYEKMYNDFPSELDIVDIH